MTHLFVIGTGLYFLKELLTDKCKHPDPPPGKQGPPGPQGPPGLQGPPGMQAAPCYHQCAVKMDKKNTFKSKQQTKTHKQKEQSVLEEIVNNNIVSDEKKKCKMF